MLDPRLLRSDPAAVAANLARRGFQLDLERLSAIEERRKAAQVASDEIRAARNAHAKTGAFSNARGLSGYVRSADGEPIVFSILANNFGTTADVIERTADAIVVTLAEFSRK